MIDATGGAATLAVTTQPECAWDVSSAVTWISGLSPASGQGAGNVEFRVAPNEGTATRDGDILVNGTAVRVSQRAPCRFTLGPASQTMTSAGGAGSVTVATASDCAWTATTDATWVLLTSPFSGNGNGTVSFSVTANGGAERAGSVSIGGQRATVTQSGVEPCGYTIAPTSESIGAAGGAGTPVRVSTQAGCRWAATSNVSWIAVSSGSAGEGDGSVAFSVSANTGASRTGNLTIAGRAFTVTQAGAANSPSCTYSISPTSQNIGAAGGTGTSAVSTQVACQWAATSNAAWITITSGVSGTGNGSSAFSVAANTGAARTGTLTVATHTFSVAQAGPGPSCTYSISQASGSVPAAGGSSTVGVTAGAGCAWAATSNAAWISITSGASGTGNGSVAFSVAANTGAARTGTLTVAGQVLTVSQAAVIVLSCQYSISSNRLDVGAQGGSASVNVSTSSGCTWTASSNDSWIAITAGASGSGDGTVTFSVGRNSGRRRNGSLTVAGRNVRIEQNDDDDDD